jgi:hypothetical protein
MWTARTGVTALVITVSLQPGAGSPRTVKTAVTAARISTRWLRLIVATPAMSPGSVHSGSARPAAQESRGPIDT